MSGEIHWQRDSGRVIRTGLLVGLFAWMGQNIIVSTRNSRWRIRVETTQSVAARLRAFASIRPPRPLEGTPA